MRDEKLWKLVFSTGYNLPSAKTCSYKLNFIPHPSSLNPSLNQKPPDNRPLRQGGRKGFRVNIARGLIDTVTRSGGKRDRSGLSTL